MAVEPQCYCEYTPAGTAANMESERASRADKSCCGLPQNLAVLKSSLLGPPTWNAPELGMLHVGCLAGWLPSAAPPVLDAGGHTTAFSWAQGVNRPRTASAVDAPRRSCLVFLLTGPCRSGVAERLFFLLLPWIRHVSHRVTPTNLVLEIRLSCQSAAETQTCKCPVAQRLQ